MLSTFTGFWSRLCTNNDTLENERLEMKISVRSFRSQMKKAYKQGAEDGVAAINDFQSVGSKNKSGFDFDKIFGNSGLF